MVIIWSSHIFEFFVFFHIFTLVAFRIVCIRGLLPAGPTSIRAGFPSHLMLRTPGLRLKVAVS